MASSICLNMIVRDEAGVIERCLASVRPFIDHWVIVDTGSVDDTPARIAKAMAGIPGQLHHRAWRNFGHNRNEALDLAQNTADYVLFMDADDTLCAPLDTQWPHLCEAAYSLEFRLAEVNYDRVCLASTKLPWQWKGVLHEYLDAGQTVHQPRIPGFWIHEVREGARSSDPKKYEKDALTLEAARLDEPDNSRYVFYLAQSYRDASMPEAALKNYQLRANMGGWDEEVWYALFECAKLSQQLAYTHEHIVGAYLKAYQARPQRAESLTALATYFRHRQEWHNSHLFASQAVQTPLPADRLFVDMSVYQWRAQDELALAAVYSGRQTQAQGLWRALLAGSHLPASERSRVEKNLAFALVG
jgi:glycosyltransferase involved in cell wall biosynthesis